MTTPTNPEERDDFDWEDGEWENCWDCGGDGHFHDCGDDTCCCLHPEIDELVTCSTCEGSGGWVLR